jgi:hypothetical protein
MQWVIPKDDVSLSRWLKELDTEMLDTFITEVEYVLDGGEGRGHLVIATILGAARGWRDDGVEPLVTLDRTASPGLYEVAERFTGARRSEPNSTDEEE